MSNPHTCDTYANPEIVPPLDLTCPVQTRDGRKVRILATDVACEQPVVGVVPRRENGESVEQWTNTGQYFPTRPDADWDLVNVPRKKTVYLNVYDSGEIGPPHDSRKSADLAIRRSINRVACKEVEIEY